METIEIDLEYINFNGQKAHFRATIQKILKLEIHAPGDKTQ